MQNLNSKYLWSELERREPPKRPATERVADFLEIYKLYDDTTAREQASRCVLCAEPACVSGCPLDNPIPEWLQLTAEGRFLEAATMLRSAINMTELCLRVCPTDRSCEGLCVVNEKSEAVSIGAIEQFLHAYALAHGPTERNPAPRNGFKVAVVGSGPGGLTCADELSIAGYAVTIFAARLTPGGLLVNGLPAFTVEKSIVERRVDALEKRGVVFQLGVRIGEDITLGELLARFDAVFLGFDSQKPRSLDVPGANLKGVVQAIPFIIQKSTATRLDIPPMDIRGKRVVVLGGGDTAMDCLRTAIRCGARETFCIYRRDEASLPCRAREYIDAKEEGARFVFQAAPIAVFGNDENRMTGLRLARTELGAIDGSGRRELTLKPGTEFVIDADWLVLALGFAPSPFPHWNDFTSLPANERDGIDVDASQMTDVAGVFAGGDIVRGPSLVMHAVQDARRAAAGIHSYLSAQSVN